MASFERSTENNEDTTIQPVDIHVLDQSKISSGNSENLVARDLSLQSSDGGECSYAKIESLSKPVLNEQLSNQSRPLNDNEGSAKDSANPSSHKTEGDDDEIIVPSLNIQLLNQSKMKQCVSSYVKTLKADRKKSFEEKISQLCPLGQFIQVYNEKQKDKAEKKFAKEKVAENENYFVYIYEKDRKNNNIDFAQIYYCKKEYLTRIQKSEISHSEATKKYDLIIFFVLKNEKLQETNTFAATTGNAWQVVRPYNDITFPIKIIQAVGSVEKIKKIERRSLFENAARETLFHPRHINLYQTSSLYYLVESVRCEMHEESGKKLLELLGKKSSVNSFNQLEDSNKDNQTTKLSEQPPRKKRKIDHREHIVYPDITITTAGSVIIEEECEVQYYFKILKFFESYLSTEVQAINNNFDFLHFFETPEERKYVLDDKLIEDIFDRFMHEKEQYVTVRHKFYEDFLLSKKFEIQISKHKHFKDIGPVAPDIHTIIEEFEDNYTDMKTFKALMKIGKLRFGYKSDSFTSPIVDYIEGEIFHFAQHYFKIRSTWYQMDVDYLSLLHQDFEKVMGEAFVREVAEGGLPLPWKKDIPLDQAVVQRLLDYSESDLAKLMKELRNMNVSYILNDTIMQIELVGEILRIPKIKKYKNEIQFALNNCPSPSKKNWCNILQKQISERDVKKNAKIPKKDMEDIWKELNKERPVLIGEKDNATLVKNPFPYLVDNEPNYQKLKQYLTDISLYQKEDDYNRSYQNIKLNGHNYIVFDQVCPDNIEPCDILCYTNDKIYLYHVKEVFGQCTRDVCSQILNSATRIQEALRTNQDDHYLKRLWHLAVEYTGDEEWRIDEKNKLLSTFSEESFIDLFYHREIVFVYAYRTPRGFEKSHPRKPISNAIINVCQDLKLMNDSGILTSKFFQMSKKIFSHELCSYDNTIEEEESKEAFDTIIFDFINKLCNRSGYMNKFGAITTKFLHINKNDFINELLSQNNEIERTIYGEAYDKMKNRVFSNSVLAKIEVIRLAEKLGTFQNRFKFKICEIRIE